MQESVPPAYPHKSEGAFTSEQTHDEWLRAEKANRHAKTRYGLGIAALAVIVPLGGAWRAIDIDQHEIASMVWGDNGPVVHPLITDVNLPHVDGTDILFTPGTGISDATPTVARPLIPAFANVAHVNMAAIQEGAHPQIGLTIDAVTSYIEKTRPKRIIWWGMSAGGKENLLLAESVREKHPDIEQVLIFDSSPDNSDTAYELAGSSKTGLSTFSADSGTTGGPYFRGGLEMAARNDQFTNTDGSIDYDRFGQTWKNVRHDKWDAQSGTNEQYIWQVMLTIDDFAEKSLDNLQNVPDKAKVYAFYIVPTHDTTINGTLATERYAKYAKEANIDFYVTNVEGRHASEHANPVAYAGAVQRILSLLTDLELYDQPAPLLTTTQEIPPLVLAQVAPAPDVENSSSVRPSK